MAKRKPDPGAGYRAAKAAVVEHVQAWATAEKALHGWLKSKRGVPPHLLYDATTGDPLDPALAKLERAVTKAQADVEWCRALVIACGEDVKGQPFEKVLAAQGRRPTADDMEDNEGD